MIISSVAVIGAGTMGRGICQLLASNGFKVSLVDLSEELARAGVTAIERNLQRLVDKGKLTNSVSQRVMSNISICEIGDVVGEDLAIECVTELLPVKHEVFKNLDSVANKSMIFATNTSSFTVREVFGPILSHRAVVGLHFFNPVHALPLVELVLPESISHDCANAIRGFLLQNGRTVVEVADSPGFVVNRVLFRMIAESCILSESGVATVEKIDTAMKAGANLPLGPFELADLIGLDTTSEILKNLGDRLSDDAFRRARQFMHSFVERGLLGRKSGKGFYEYG